MPFSTLRGTLESNSHVSVPLQAFPGTHPSGSGMTALIGSRGGKILSRNAPTSKLGIEGELTVINLAGYKSNLC